MKAALITGANKGIGFQIAKQLGQLGFKVILAGRNATRLKDAQNRLSAQKIVSEVLVMDVGDSESIKKEADNFKALGLQLDVLVNNAAILQKEDKSLLSDSESVFLDTVEVNAVGVLRVTKAFLPFMKRPSRIINISSGGGSMTDSVGGWSPAYCTSKTFLNMITRQLAHELQSKNIAVNAVCPGWVRTDMGGASASRSVEQGAETPVWLATKADGTFSGQFFRDKKAIDW